MSGNISTASARCFQRVQVRSPRVTVHPHTPYAAGSRMPSNIVLVTGVAGELGGKLLARLGNNPDFERVIGVDTVPPAKAVLQRMGHAEFVRADIRNPLIAKVISTARVDTVVHASCTAHPAGPGRRTAIKEVNVI